MKKKILIIDDSSMYREFLQTQLSGYGFDMSSAINGLDGVSKIRSFMPDLVIMDYLLSRKSSQEVLRDKMKDPNSRAVPVIMCSSEINREMIQKVAPFGVKKFLSKPIKIDALLAALSELLAVEIQLDDTPCLLDAHLNDKILFVEIARGFNNEKISLLQYKIAELLKLYKVEFPRILILMTDIQVQDRDEPKLARLLRTIENFVTTFDQVRILSLNEGVKQYIKYHLDFKRIKVASSLEEAINGLLGIKGLESMTSEQDGVQDVLLSSRNDQRSQEAFQLNFQDERGNMEDGLKQQKLNIAVVDDDFIVHNIIAKALSGTSWSMVYFNNGRDFTGALETHQFDLLLLDLMMPEMDGFAVMQKLEEKSVSIPTIILSALSRKEGVCKAREYGVSGYLVKPLKPEKIVKKIMDVMLSKAAE